MSKSINSRIAKIRKAKGFRQYQVAELLGMKTTAYSQMERTGRIYADRIVSLASIFNVDVKELLFDGAEPVKEIAKPVKIPEPEFSLTEINLITIMRNFPKTVRDDVYAFIDKKYRENK